MHKRFKRTLIYDANANFQGTLLLQATKRHWNEMLAVILVSDSLNFSLSIFCVSILLKFRATSPCKITSCGINKGCRRGGKFASVCVCINLFVSGVLCPFTLWGISYRRSCCVRCTVRVSCVQCTKHCSLKLCTVSCLRLFLNYVGEEKHASVRSFVSIHLMGISYRRSCCVWCTMHVRCVQCVKHHSL